MEDIKQSIKDLWLKGLSARQIGAELGATRGSVIGKIFRMREAGKIGIRECDARMHSIRKETKKLEDEKVLTLFDLMRESPLEKEEKAKPKPEGEILVLALPTTETIKYRPVKFDQLVPKMCRYVINDGPAKDFLFCGQPKNGRAYCKEHETLCYYRIERKGKS
jgi:hypothetical protein